MKPKLFSLLFTAILSQIAFSPSLGASTITVNTEADIIDTPECTLREAIASVNNGGALGGCQAVGDGVPDTVVLPAGNYVLSLPGTDEDNCGNGDLDVLANLTLNGAGSGNTSISAEGLKPDTPERVFDINPFGNSDISVTFNGVTIRDGDDFVGGGIQILGEQSNLISFVKAGSFGSTVSVVLNDVVVTENMAFIEGGGVNNFGADLTLNNSQVTQNQAENFTGGGISHQGGCFKCVDAALLVVNSGGLLTLQNTTISGNSAVAGGGVYNEAELVMDSSTVSGNTAGNDGGGIYGGFGSLALITNSTVSGNQALGENISTIVLSDMKLGFFPNDGAGGGIYQILGALALVNSTVSGNSAGSLGGGLFFITNFPNLQAGEGLAQGNGVDLGLFNVTMARNTAGDAGGGVLLFEVDFNGDLTAGATGFQSVVANSLIAANTAGAGADCVGAFGSQGYNLIGQVDDNCVGFAATGDRTGSPSTPLDPRIGDLQNNGGPTQTHGLLQGSPAIDTANPDGCLDEDGLPLTRDQRNLVRPVNATGLAAAICDIGAYEVGGAVLRVVKSDDTGGQSVALGETFTYTITVTNEGPNLATDVQLSDPLPGQVDFLGPITASQGSCNNAGDVVTCALGEIPVGATVTVSFAVTAVSPSTTVVNTVTVTTSTKEFENTGTFTATVTTNLGGGLLEGAGCALSLDVAGSVQTLSAMLPLALALALAALRRLSRRE